MIVTDMLGARDIYRFEQQTGAWIAFGCIPLWMGRRHYGRIIRKVFGIAQRSGEPPPDDSGEPMRYRAAAGLFTVGPAVSFLLLFSDGDDLLGNWTLFPLLLSDDYRYHPYSRRNWTTTASTHPRRSRAGRWSWR